ncbi:hypothetical protein GCM10010363_71850 [Streptomyces omiyaensis]|nr:hypothetical protein GCM10010363_71850 [Streptomyces omiyaensis]
MRARTAREGREVSPGGPGRGGVGSEAFTRAHHDLSRRNPQTTSVARVAAHGGFARSGRFAAACREAYGPGPSGTLRA